MSLFDRAWVAIYDRAASAGDRRGDYRKRQRLVAPATGVVLEVGAGTGRNLPLYRDAVRVVALEPDGHARRYAAERAPLAPMPVEVIDGDAQALPFADDTFDTVVMSLVLCTIPSLETAVAEARRVLVSGGELRFWEHVRSADPEVAARQDRFERPWGWVGRGCHPNRDTVAAITAAGFEVVEVEDYQADGVPGIVKPHVLGVAHA